MQYNNFRKNGEEIISFALERYLSIRNISVKEFASENSIDKMALENIIKGVFSEVSMKNFFDVLEAIGAEDRIKDIIPGQLFVIDKGLVNTREDIDKLVAQYG